MKYTVYEIYVEGLFAEAWEEADDAINRALNLQKEFGTNNVKLYVNELVEMSLEDK